MSLIVSAKHQFDLLMPHGSPEEQAARLAAWRRMEILGLPTRKTETWKYSSLATLDKIPWQPGQRGLGSLNAEWNRWIDQWSKNFYIAVQINGRYQPHLSHPGGGLILGLADMAKYTAEDGFSSLSLAVAQPGLRIEVPPETKVDRPLLLLRFQESGTWMSTFNQIRLGPSSELKLAEIFAGVDTAYLRTVMTEVRLGERASLNWVRRQDEAREAYHFHETQAYQRAYSRLHFTQLSRGAKWSRGQMCVNLDGAGAEAHVHGLTFAAGAQHMDQRVVLVHSHGQTASTQLFKGVYRDAAKGSLNGKIFIARDAQKVSSQQMTHNLLLSPNAEANTKPELEIYADDVKANHGATVGRLDEEKMFYLRSRGLNALEAEQALSEAFAKDVFMKIPDANLRRFMEAGHGS